MGWSVEWFSVQWIRCAAHYLIQDGNRNEKAVVVGELYTHV